MNTHTVEKIGGTSMLDYAAVRDNIILAGGENTPYGRIFVVSAYAGITNRLLEHKKSGRPGVYALFASSEHEGSWREEFTLLRGDIYTLNEALFPEPEELKHANDFIDKRLASAERCLEDLQRLCQHGHFALESHLATVREMLASLGEAHSAWNTATLLQRDGVEACFIDLTAWRSEEHLPLDDRILDAMKGVDVHRTIPIVTGYAHSDDGLMESFDRGYSEMTFSRLAVLTEAREAIIHKEYHLSSADPKVVGEENVVPIGRTNYDVADQLANLGMEAIHPKAAKGLRKSGIPLRIKNTFEPEHTGTLLTPDYVSSTPCVEIIAGSRNVYALELFDQDMVGQVAVYDREILAVMRRFRSAYHLQRHQRQHHHALPRLQPEVHQANPPRHRGNLPQCRTRPAKSRHRLRDWQRHADSRDSRTYRGRTRERQYFSACHAPVAPPGGHAVFRAAGRLRQGDRGAAPGPGRNHGSWTRNLPGSRLVKPCQDAGQW